MSAPIATADTPSALELLARTATVRTLHPAQDVVDGTLGRHGRSGG